MWYCEDDCARSDVTAASVRTGTRLRMKSPYRTIVSKSVALRVDNPDEDDGHDDEQLRQPDAREHCVPFRPLTSGRMSRMRRRARRRQGQAWTLVRSAR